MALVAVDTGAASRAVGLTVVVTLAALGAMSALHHDVSAQPASASLLWIVMTIGMMAPSAIPMVAAFSKMAEKLDDERSPLALAAVFLLAYLVLWSAYGIAAAALQNEMRSWFLITDDMALSNPLLAAALVGAAAVFQLSPLKHVCLTKCRSPLGFLGSSYRPGYGMAFRIGLHHAAFCIGCCWLLMALAWVGGAMNMSWMTILSIVVILEKTLPPAAALDKIIGIGLCALAACLVVWKGQEGLYLFKVIGSLCRNHT